jgi:hypothetical protein
MLKRWFSDSETILWARLQMLIGVVLNGLTLVPPDLWQPLLPPRWFAILVLANGIATEVLRRRREKDM